MTRIEPAGFVLRGHHVLLGMLAFFAAVIAVNVSFAVIAVRSFPGEDVRRSYLQGLNYNETIAERRAQAALGWRADAVLAGSGPDATVVVNLSTRTGAPLNGATLSGELRWPADARRDQTLAFTRQGDGRYAASVGALAAGRWRLRARAADANGEALDFESELTWQPSR
jgi:nitrogen fixation protein FixH